jgi:outer membrane protein assembly factor BamB
MLWRSPRTLGRKLLGTAGLCLYGIFYAAVLVLLLIRFGGAQVEWRGGYVPVLTWHKTATDLTALERSRAAQTNTTRAESPRVVGAPYWTGFRGAQRDGHYDELPILTNWPATGLRLLWKQPCGGGYSSFAIAGGRAFTIEQRREEEMVVAYDVETGRELWTNGWPARFTEMHSDEGPRTTPEYDEGKLFTLGAAGELRCLEAATGKTIWRKNIVTENDAKVPAYGLAASPLLVDDKLIVQNYDTKDRTVVCYDKHDGRLLWHVVDMAAGYASPVLANFGGERQVVIGARPDVFGLRLEDGVLRWSAPWPILNHERPIAQPVLIGTNRVLFSAAYLTGATLFEVNRTGDTYAVKEVWRSRKLKTKFAGAVLWQGFLYGLDEDILTCLDAETGEQKWKDGRYGYGQLVLANGHLIVLCGNGDLALVQATPERLVELSRFPAIHGKTWNYPAVAGGRLLVRNLAEMACFEIATPR